MNKQSYDLKLSTLSNLKKQNTQPNSVTKVHFNLGCPRKSVSFKCNKELWNAFVWKCKLENVSVCHVLEPVVLALTTSEVHLSNTIHPLNIENFVVERAVKRVRRYERVVEEEKVVERNVSVCCVYCGLESIGLFEYVKTGAVFPLCSFHAGEFLDGGAWRVPVSDGLTEGA